MSTKNIVPRTGSQGEIGTSAKPWDKAHIDEVTASIGLSGTFLYGDGAGIINIPADTLDQVTTAGNTTTNTISVSNVTASAGVVAVGVHSTDVTASAGMVASYFVGALKGNADTATSATNADTVDTKHATDFTLDYTTTNGNTTTNTISVSNVTASAGVVANYFIGDGTGITGVTGDWDGQHTGDAGITGSLAITGTISVSGSSNFGNLVTDSHIFTGSFHQTGSGTTSTFNDRIITSGSMKVTAPAGTSEVFRAEGTGGFVVNTDGNVDIDAIGNDLTLTAGSTATIKGSQIDLNSSAAPNDINAYGRLSASLGITGSSFVGDGSGLTGVTGDWDGQHTGDAGITGSLELKTDSGLILQSTSSTTPSAATTTHNFLTVTDASGTTTSTFKYTNENPPGGAPPDLFQKTLNISASSGTDVLITAGNQSVPYGAGGNITLDSALATINGTDSVALISGADISIDGATTTVNGNSLALNSVSDATVQCIAGNIDIKSVGNASLSGSLTTIRAGAYAYMDTRHLVVQGQDASYDELLYYASPSSYGISHFRYLSYGYDNTYNCAKFTAGYGGTGGDNQFIWYVSNDTSSEHPVMLLDFSGNLGIGTVTPTKTLDVVGNISASQEISASSFWGDGSGLTNVPFTETDTLATVTARGASTTTPVLFNTHITASSGIDSGPLHVVGQSSLSGTISIYAGAGVDFFGEDGSSSGSIGPHSSGGGLRLQADPLLGQGVGIDANTGITGSLNLTGLVSASLGITASSFVGDGSGLTGVTGDWDGQHTGDAGITGSLDVLGALSSSSNIAATKITASVYLDNFLSTISFENTGTLIWAKNTGQDLYLEAGRDVYIRPDRDVKIYKGTGSGTNWVNFDGDDQKVEVTGDLSASLGITGSSLIAGEVSSSYGISGSEVHATEIYGANYHQPGVLSPTYSISSLGMFIYNDITVGINSEPDTFVVDRDAKKVGVNCDIVDLPDANFSVSGSTALGNLVTDTHIISGSTEVYVEAQTGLQVLQNVASSGYPVARFENTNAGGSTYIETHGTNQGGLKMYRGGVLRATIDTAGNAFTMYAGTPVPANLGFMIQSGKAEFKETTGDNFTGTKAQLNISASSGPAIRIDSGATGNETTFKVEDYTTTIVSGSADLLTMTDTTAPPTPSSAAHMYAKSGEMFVMDTAGNETQISPHDDEGEWQYFSRNTKTGKVTRIRMEKMIRKLEELTGETFIEEE